MPPCLALCIKGWIGGKTLQRTHATETGHRLLVYGHSWLSKAFFTLTYVSYMADTDKGQQHIVTLVWSFKMLNLVCLKKET